ncbi:MAG: hypothetical protein AAGF88_01185 [Pseudomonadota bacterium]
MALITFVKEESGAVTVDWVVLTGALVGLGLATTAVVSAGIGDLSNDVSDELSGQSISTRFTRFAQTMGFDNGLGNWLGGTVTTSDAYGNVLQMGGTGGLQGTQASFDLDPNAAYAVATFDMHAIDSWDGESFQVFVNNEVVATASFRNFGNDEPSSWVSDNPDITFSMQATTGRSNVSYGSYDDQSFQMQVTVANAGSDMTLGFGSTLDQGMSDESWAVDNISVVSANEI